MQSNAVGGTILPMRCHSANRPKLWMLVVVTPWMVLCLVHSVSASDGIELISPSMKAMARGGADVAVGDSALSQIDNPATLTLAPRDGCQFDLAARWALSIAHYRGPIDTADSEHRDIFIGNAALTIPVNDRLTLGAVFHSKAGLGTRFRLRHLMIPFMDRRVGSDMKIIDLQLNAGYKLTDKLSVGAGIRMEIATAEFSTVLGPVDFEFGRGWAYGGGFQLGLHYQARDDLAFGLAYRSPTWFTDLDGGEGEASLFGLVPISLGGVGIDKFRLPQRVTAGVAWDATDWLKLVGEVRWLNYSNSSFHSMTIATDGFVDLRYPFPLGYRDQLIFIAGAEFKLDERWILGVGYHYGTEPVDRSNVLPIGSSITQHHATIGLRYEEEKWWFGITYVRTFPETLRGNGWSDIPLGIDYGFTEMEQEQHSICIGFGFRL